jgi:hypothetical protein
MPSWKEVLTVALSLTEPCEVGVAVLIAMVFAVVIEAVIWRLCRHLRRATRSLWSYVYGFAQSVCLERR